MPHPPPVRGNREGLDDLFSLVSGDPMGGNGLKLHRGMLRLDRRKKFFTEMVVKHWNKVPKRSSHGPRPVSI